MKSRMTGPWFFPVIFVFLSFQFLAAQKPAPLALQLNFQPFRPLNPNLPALMGGVQLTFRDRLAICYNFGYSFHPMALKHWNQERKQWKYQVHQLDLKAFLINDDSGFLPYGICGFFFIPQSYRKDYDWVSINGTSFDYTSSDIDRTVEGWWIGMGWEYRAGGWCFDSNFGIGVKKLYIRHDLENPSVNLDGHFEEWFSYLDRRAGGFTRPHFQVTFKFGYYLVRK